MFSRKETVEVPLSAANGSNDLDQPLESIRAQSDSAPSYTIVTENVFPPLFEHFLVVGVSLEVI